MDHMTATEPSLGEAEAGDPAISERVIEAVAAAAGVDPMDLSPPLFAAVDPDALDRLFATTSPWDDPAVRRVTFSYGGYAVTVHADGAVDVEPEERDGAADHR